MYKRKKNLRKISKPFYIFLTTPDKVAKDMQSNSSDNFVHCYNVEISNLFGSELQLISTKPLIKNKLKDLLSELQKFEIHTLMVIKSPI